MMNVHYSWILGFMLQTLTTILLEIKLKFRFLKIENIMRFILLEECQSINQDLSYEVVSKPIGWQWKYI